MKKYEPMPGERIEDTCAKLVQMVNDSGGPVSATFNDIELVASVGMTAGDLEQSWRDESDRRREAYESSPEYKQRLEEAKRRDAEKKSQLQSALSSSPPMEFSDEKAWDRFVASNQDPYGGRVVRYAEEWARLMQSRVAAGKTIAECAEETSHLADDDGITGFMYGCAVSVLSNTWRHGEELRRWHNTSVQIGDEGDRANESGGVLNPAVLGVSAK